MKNKPNFGTKFFLTLLHSVVTTVFSQGDAVAQPMGNVSGITAEELRGHVYFLASDEMKGRGTGTTEYMTAVQYAATQFRAAGLSTINSSGNNKPSYLQKFLIKKDSLERSSIVSYNVIGAVEGTDENLKNEYIVVGAHLDHLGIRNGEIFNGANDNATGSASVIELAESVATSPLRRSVIFLLFGAGEIGLLGSGNKFLTRNDKPPIRPSLSVKYSLSDSLAAWLNTERPKEAMKKFDRAKDDTSRWFLSEDREYGDLITIGHTLLDEEKLDIALLVFKAAEEVHPQSYRPHAGLWEAYKKTGQPKKVQTAQNKALFLNKGLYANDRKKAIELRGQIPVSYLFVETLFDAGPERAIAQYRKTLSNEPERAVVDPLVLIRGGQQLREAMQLEQALQVFTFITEEYSDWPIGYMGVAETHRMLGNRESTIKAYRKVLRLNPGNQQAVKKINEIEQSEY